MDTNFNWKWCISYIQADFKVISIIFTAYIVAKLCTTNHQSYQKPETLSVGC